MTYGSASVPVPVLVGGSSMDELFTRGSFSVWFCVVTALPCGCGTVGLPVWRHGCYPLASGTTTDG
jgi:hypothetical protein